jgi:hypothetical protein
LINGHDYDDDTNWQPVVGKEAKWHDNDTDKCGDGEEILICILCTTQTKGAPRPGAPCKGTEGLVLKTFAVYKEWYNTEWGGNWSSDYGDDLEGWIVHGNYGLAVANVCIPDVHPVNSEPVVAIGVRTFFDSTSSGNETITKVLIGKNIIDIGRNAFYYCTSLESITIPAGVTTIGEGAFYNCESLETVTVLARNPPTLKQYVFDNTHAGLVIIVPSGRETVYQSAWSAYADKISAMEKVKIEKPALTVNIFDHDGNSKTVTLTAVNDAYTLSGVITQTNVGNYTATVTLTNTALYEWTDGTIAVLNLNWKIIDCRICENAPCTCGCTHPSYTWKPVPGKEGWHNNTTVDCEEGEEIQTCNVCNDTTGLPRSFPCKGTEGLVFKTLAVYKEWYDDELGNWSENYGADLEGWIVHGNYQLNAANVCIPDVHPVDGKPVEVIGAFAFSDTDDAWDVNQTITSVRIGKNIIIIDYAFNGLPKLKTATFAADSQLETIGRDAFKDCTNLESITILTSVKTIGIQAFSGCLSLESITIPTSVTSIDMFAFFNCKFSSITIPSSVTTMGDRVFYGWTAEQTIIVPFADGAKPDGWHNNWNGNCNADIQYTE